MRQFADFNGYRQLFFPDEPSLIVPLLPCVSLPIGPYAVIVGFAQGRRAPLDFAGAV